MLNINNEADNSLFSQMEDFVKTAAGTSWCIVLSDNGKNKVFEKRLNRPCYGEMRSYGKGSTRPDDVKPSDLPRPLPINKYREAVGVPFHQFFFAINLEPLINFVFSPKDSPWRVGLPDEEHIHVVKGEYGEILGVILTDVRVDATVMVSLFRFIKGFAASTATFNQQLKKTNDPFLSLVTTLGKGVSKYGLSTEYHFSAINSLKNFKEGKVRKLSSDIPTFAEGDDYNRPHLAFPFVPEEIIPEAFTGLNQENMPEYLSFKSFLGETIPSVLKAHGLMQD